MRKSSTLQRALVRFWVPFLLAVRQLKQAEAEVREYKWEVKYEYKSPDCFKKLVMTINGMSPGPQISANQNDIIKVVVKSSLPTENIAIHWHGIRQRHNCWSDGTAYVTQCPIMPGKTFTYKFVVDKAGSYLYHAHYGTQKEVEIYGTINVALPNGQIEPFKYDLEHTILLSDWYHKSSYDESTGLSSIPYKFVGEPQSLLINGRGKFDCSGLPKKICNATSTECSRDVFTVTPGKTYRLRIGSLTSLSSLSFQIEGHKMIIVEADGHYVEEFEVDNLYIHSGETYSVLLRTKKEDPPRNYWITTNVVSREPKTPLGKAILNYSPIDSSKQPETNPPEGPKWNDTSSRFKQSSAIVAREGSEKPPPTSNRTIVLLNTQNKVDGFYRWSLNNVSLNLPATPYLAALKYNIKDAFEGFNQTPPDNYDSVNYDIESVPKNVNATSSSGIYRLEFNSVVDVILQNANTMTEGHSETHPWHLHGHDFWVLHYGQGKFEKDKHTKHFNLKNPIMKNTVPLHPYGWTAVRFRADNPGVWLFHCHIESHFFMGMSVVFAEGIDKVGKLPSSIMGCDKTKDLFEEP